MTPWINDYEFEQMILNRGEAFVVTWMDLESIPCRHFKPEIEKLAHIFREVLFLFVNAREHPTLNEICAITSAPTTVLFIRGERVGPAWEGPYSAEALERRMREAVPGLK